MEISRTIYQALCMYMSACTRVRLLLSMLVQYRLLNKIRILFTNTSLLGGR